MDTEKAKLITLDVRQNTINRANKLKKTADYHGDICPLSLAGRKIFRGKNQKVYVNYSAQLVVDYFENGIKKKTEYYSPVASEKARQFVRNFDATVKSFNDKVKPVKFRYQLSQTF